MQTLSIIAEPSGQLNLEASFRSLIENSTDILVVVNGEGRIIYSSPSIEKHFGLSNAEQFGQSAFDYIHPDDIPRLAENFMELLENPGKPLSVQTRAKSKDGSQIWVEGIVTNLLGTEGINGIVCNFRDVTERVKAEQALQQAEDLSRQLERQLTEEKIYRQKEILRATLDAQEKEREDIGRELHDNVNQILTTARLYLDCINGQGHEQQHHIIERSSSIITTAIEEIRKLSGSMTQSFHKEVGLKLSIEDLVENIRRLSEHIRISFDFSLPGEELLDDKLKMAIFRITQEQLNNVLKHAAATRIHISLRRNETVLSLQISDNGKGFDTRKKRKGIGINNIINRAEFFSGHVVIDSSPGNGCLMSVDFRLGR
ncbi:MAG TPA: PAS domain S-box protein [Puia sp.]|nr:PAS domain S-box protein [Puia sp.]